MFKQFTFGSWFIHFHTHMIYFYLFVFHEKNIITCTRKKAAEWEIFHVCLRFCRAELYLHTWRMNINSIMIVGSNEKNHMTRTNRENYENIRSEMMKFDNPRQVEWWFPKLIWFLIRISNFNENVSQKYMERCNEIWKNPFNIYFFSCDVSWDNPSLILEPYLYICKYSKSVIYFQSIYKSRRGKITYTKSQNVIRPTKLPARVSIQYFHLRTSHFPKKYILCNKKWYKIK